MTSGSTVCVAHLVRKANGLEPFEAFLASYRAHPAGTDHELVLLMKGFDSPSEADWHARIADGFAARTVFLPDVGFDIGSYLAAARLLDHEYFCFLNSFSVVQSDGWLAKMRSALGTRVGLVGASGSYGSHLSGLLYVFGVGAYRRIFLCDADGRQAVRSHFIGHSVFRTLLHPLWAIRSLPAFSLGFETFPAYHIRTNAFLIPRDLLRAARFPEMRTKMDAWRFESGRRSLTRQVERIGQRAVVVGADGTVYQRDEWHQSRTFWQSSQENLLVADNQTRDYLSGDWYRRVFLSRLAWGEHAEPARELGRPSLEMTSTPS